MPDAKPKPWKERGVDVLLMGAVLALVSTLHTIIVLPATLEKTRTIAREETAERMDQHEKVMEARMSSLHQRLAGLATQEGLAAVRQQLQSIDERLRHLERKGK